MAHLHCPDTNASFTEKDRLRRPIKFDRLGVRWRKSSELRRKQAESRENRLAKLRARSFDRGNLVPIRYLVDDFCEREERRKGRERHDPAIRKSTYELIAESILKSEFNLNSRCRIAFLSGSPNFKSFRVTHDEFVDRTSGVENAAEQIIDGAWTTKAALFKWFELHEMEMLPRWREKEKLAGVTVISDGKSNIQVHTVTVKLTEPQIVEILKNELSRRQNTDLPFGQREAVPLIKAIDPQIEREIIRSCLASVTGGRRQGRPSNAHN